MKNSRAGSVNSTAALRGTNSFLPFLRRFGVVGDDVDGVFCAGISPPANGEDLCVLLAALSGSKGDDDAANAAGRVIDVKHLVR